MLVFIEVSKGSNLKYEHNKDLDIIVLDRVLHNTHKFPYNYGYIPNTLSPDGDPLDVIVLCNYALNPGYYVDCKIVGVIETSDENGEDDKIIAVPVDKCDPRSKHYNNVKDVNETDMKEILYFLQHYKDGEEGKSVKLGKVKDRDEALKTIDKCMLVKK